MEIREYKTYIEAEILNLYSSVGWTAYIDQADVLRKGFEHSLLALAAYEEKQLVGMIRVVGDGYTIVYIQDILILPEYQRRGIGSLLIRRILERFAHVRQIHLAADNTAETVGFYKALGFTEFSEMGCCGFMKV